MALKRVWTWAQPSPRNVRPSAPLQARPTPSVRRSKLTVALEIPKWAATCADVSPPWSSCYTRLLRSAT